MEIVVAQLNSEKVEIENCDQSRQAMPWDKEVDEMKNSDEDTLEQRGFEVGRVHHDGKLSLEAVLRFAGVCYDDKEKSVDLTLCERTKKTIAHDLCNQVTRATSSASAATTAHIRSRCTKPTLQTNVVSRQCVGSGTLVPLPFS